MPSLGSQRFAGALACRLVADTLRRAFEERRNVDYFIDPENPELAEFAGPEQFVEESVEGFVERIDELIEAEELR